MRFPGFQDVNPDKKTFTHTEVHGRNSCGTSLVTGVQDQVPEAANRSSGRETPITEPEKVLDHFQGDDGSGTEYSLDVRGTYKTKDGTEGKGRALHATGPPESVGVGGRGGLG